MGEYLVQCAVEASYMIGLERNAKSVALACYAPMLANVDYINWKPDMIWFDNHRVFGTANYYVQKIFMENQGDYRLESKIVDGLETVVIEAESEKISGRILLSGNESKIAYSDILFTDLMTGEQQHFGGPTAGRVRPGSRSPGRPTRCSRPALPVGRRAPWRRRRSSGGVPRARWSTCRRRSGSMVSAPIPHRRVPSARIHWSGSREGEPRPWLG